MNNFLFGDASEDSNILRGEAANVGSLRTCIIAGNEEGQKIALAQLAQVTAPPGSQSSTSPSSLAETNFQSALFPVQVSLSGNLNEEDDYEAVSGYVGITSKQLIFVAAVESNDITDDTTTMLEMEKNDVVVDAKCINLHAISQDPSPSVYVQMQNMSEESEPIEMNIIPKEQESCQVLFDALSHLISLHPISLDDEEQYEDAGDSGMIWATMDDNSSSGATEEERAAMLERLDNLLVVKPELEIKDDNEQYEADGDRDGQFDDADDDDIL